MLEKIAFLDDENKKVELYVLDTTKVAGVNYLLVAESEDDDSDCYIFKEVNVSDDEICYEPVDDDRELEYIGKIFQELMDAEEADEE